jgi:hypothetical protein
MKQSPVKAEYVTYCDIIHSSLGTEHKIDISMETTAVEVAVNLRPTVGRPVCPGVRSPSGLWAVAVL